MSGQAVPFEILWKHHRGSIERLVQTISQGRGNEDSFRVLVAAGQVALWEASKLYDDEKIRGGTFWGYAQRRVRGAIYDEMRSWDHLPRSGRTRLKNDDLGSVPWALIYPCGLTPAQGIAVDDNPEESAALAEQAEKTKQVIAKLPPQEKQVAVKSRLERKTLTEISREMGVTLARICQIRTEVVRKIREDH